MEGEFERVEELQIFQVSETKAYQLHVNVLKGENISKGKFKDKVDTPDPYVILEIKGIPCGKKRTKTINDNQNPVWDESFTFYLDPNKKNVLNVFLHESNVLFDEEMGEQSINLNDLKINQEVIKILKFKKDSKVHLKLLMEEDEDPDLRYSVELCDEEIKFVDKRKQRVQEAIPKILGSEYAPKKLDEVPVIGVLASGGGYRALIGYAGVLSALRKSGILDCVTYIAGLSGSSWCLTWLFSHPEFPKKGPDVLLEELRECVSGKSYKSALKSINSHVQHVKMKRDLQQPVSFTDIFGHLVGKMLLNKRKQEVFSSLREKLTDADIPMPLCTCLNVKTDVSAQIFGDWIEFSPFEVGWAKYGAFMKTEYFGSLFYMGNIVKRYKELPLHFLLGCWGNAFSILPDRLLPGGDSQVFKKISDSEVVKNDDTVLNKRLPIVENDSLVLQENLSTNNGHFTEDHSVLRNDRSRALKLTNEILSEKHDSDVDDSESHDDNKDEEIGDDVSKTECDSQNGEHESNDDLEDEEENEGNMNREDQGRNDENPLQSRGFVLKTLTMALKKFGLFRTRDVRAGRIFNPLRGLPMGTTKKINRCTAVDGDFQRELAEAVEREAKEQCLVDAGLSFNLPFPLLLRPQRNVDLYLSFDFSTRISDFHEPFKELILAEKWAKINNVAFPPVKKLAQKYCKEAMREMYIFEDRYDPKCPVILHFIVFNNQFREYKEPGVKRETEEEKKFANFDVYSDPEDNFSMFKFKYKRHHFDQLSQLMEFNTLLGLEEIHNQMKKIIKKKKGPFYKLLFNSIRRKMSRS